MCEKVGRSPGLHNQHCFINSYTRTGQPWGQSILGGGPGEVLLSLLLLFYFILFLFKGYWLRVNKNKLEKEKKNLLCCLIKVFKNIELNKNKKDGKES